MADNVKVLIGERNGTELEFQEEYELIAENVPYNNTDSTLSAEDIKAALDELDNEKTAVIARATIQLLNNGTLGNNEWIGYTELIPGDQTPIVVPWNSKLVEITFSNNKTNVDGAINFYKNGTNSGDIFRTWSFTNVNKTQVLTGIQDSFSSGDTLYLRWDDNGQNPTDTVIMLFFTLDA